MPKENERRLSIDQAMAEIHESIDDRLERIEVQLNRVVSAIHVAVFAQMLDASMRCPWSSHDSTELARMLDSLVVDTANVWFEIVIQGGDANFEE